MVVVVVVVASSGGGKSSGSCGLFKFTEKHDKNHETNNKAHTHAPRMYTPMYYEPQNIIDSSSSCSSSSSGSNS